MLAIFPFLWAIDTAHSWLKDWRAFSQLELCISAAMSVWLAGILVCFMLPRGRRILNQYWARGALLCGAVVFALLFTEAVLRVAFPGQLFDPHARHTWPVGIQQVLRPNLAVIPGASKVARITVNADGIRGPAMPADRQIQRVLCVGGSSTECLYLDDKKTWPWRFMELFNERHPNAPCWVGNSGVSGKASLEHLHFLEESDWLKKVDAVVIMLGINDLTRDLAGSPDGNISSMGAPLWTKARVLALVRCVWIRERAKKSVVQDERGEWYREAQRKRQTSRIIAQVPLREEDVSRYEERLQRLAQLCKTRHVRLLFVNQPTVWREDLPPEAEARLWFGWIPSEGYLAAGFLRRAIDRYDAALRRVCQRESVPLVDLKMMNGKEEYFYDDCHFTEAGAERVAQELFAIFSADSPPKVGLNSGP